MQARLASFLERELGAISGAEDPEWLFVIEPEIRSVPAVSRLIHDVAGWKAETTGFPDGSESLIERAPEWVAEVLSPGSESKDREEKRIAYGLIGVGWYWIVDADARTIDVFRNVRGRMVPHVAVAAGESICADPFPTLTIEPGRLFRMPDRPKPSGSKSPSSRRKRA